MTLAAGGSFDDGKMQRRAGNAAGARHNISVSQVEIRDLGEPEAVVTHPLGATYQVRLAGTVVSRHVLQPGWSWEEHERPRIGTASYELYG